MSNITKITIDGISYDLGAKGPSGDSIAGAKGPKGDTGPQGPAGTSGGSVTISSLATSTSWSSWYQVPPGSTTGCCAWQNHNGCWFAGGNGSGVKKYLRDKTYVFGSKSIKSTTETESKSPSCCFSCGGCG